MVRNSIRVVLVAEKDLLEVASDPDAEQPRRSSQRRLLAVRKINPRSKAVKKNETIYMIAWIYSGSVGSSAVTTGGKNHSVSKCGGKNVLGGSLAKKE